MNRNEEDKNCKRLIMTKRLLILYFCLVLPCCIVNASASKNEKPNIVFIFADDMSHKTAGFMGHKTVRTPHLDKLAAQGVIFNKAYNMGSWTPAVCMTSRSMINSGLSMWRSHDVEKTLASLSPQAKSKKKSKKKKNGKNKKQKQTVNNSLSKEQLAENQIKQSAIIDTLWSSRMKKAGYDTYMTGKWHVKAPAEASFDEVGTVRAGMPKQSKQRYTRSFNKELDNWSPYDKSMGGFWAGGQHWSETLADEAIGYLNKKQNSSKPFFMYIAFNAPHDPRQAPKAFVDMYPISDIELPKSYQAQNPDMETMGLLGSKKLGNKKADSNKAGMRKGKILRDESLGPMPRTEYSTLVNRQEYYAAITHLDAQVGRIVKELTANNQLDNTIIIFTADHGLAIGEHGLLGKQNLFEHSMRAPFFIQGKGIPQGEVRNTPIYIQDAMATSLDIAKASTEAIEFNSVMPIINDNSSSSYNAIYGAYVNTQRAIIVNNYKLILYPKTESVRLFDLNKDPDELTDLSLHIEYTTKKKSLFSTLLKEQQLKADSLKLEGIYPELLQ
jgi:choline-sulfatase